MQNAEILEWAKAYILKIDVTIGFRQQKRQYAQCKEVSFRAKSRNLRIRSTFAVKLVPRSFDSLTLAQDDSYIAAFLLYMLAKPDNHKIEIHFRRKYLYFAFSIQHSAFERQLAKLQFILQT